MGLRKSKNTAGLIVNDKYCASILANGGIKVITKRRKSLENNDSFKRYLELENILLDNQDESEDADYDLYRVKKNFKINILESALAIALFILTMFFMKDASLAISIASKILIGSVGVVSVGTLIDNVNKQSKLNETIENLKEEERNLMNEYKQFDMLQESVLIPSHESSNSERVCTDNIIESAHILYQVLTTFLERKANEKIEKTDIVYLDNIFVKENISISLPLTDKQIKKAQEIIESTVNKDYMGIRSDKFNAMLSDSEAERAARRRMEIDSEDIKRLLKKYIF